MAWSPWWRSSRPFHDQSGSPAFDIWSFFSNEMTCFVKTYIIDFTFYLSFQQTPPRYTLVRCLLYKFSCEVQTRNERNAIFCVCGENTRQVVFSSVFLFWPLMITLFHLALLYTKPGRERSSKLLATDSCFPISLLCYWIYRCKQLNHF